MKSEFEEYSGLGCGFCTSSSIFAQSKFSNFGLKFYGSISKIELCEIQVEFQQSNLNFSLATSNSIFYVVWLSKQKVTLNRQQKRTDPLTNST